MSPGIVRGYCERHGPRDELCFLSIPAASDLPCSYKERLMGQERSHPRVPNIQTVPREAQNLDWGLASHGLHPLLPLVGF